MLSIDGSYGEGGGQILRYALALAAITKIPFQIYNIRKGRKKPGLMNQHLAAVRACGRVGSARVEGDEYGSTELKFIPGEIRGGDYRFDVAAERGSAGSVALVLQALLPVLVATEQRSRISVRGGTHVPFAPIYDYLNEVLIPTLYRLGLDIKASIRSYGFYPRGGGEVSVEIGGGEIGPLNLGPRGRLLRLKARSVVANLPEEIAVRQLKPITERYPDIETEVRVVSSVGAGTYIFIKAEYEEFLAGFSALGKKGKPAEKVGEECLEEFLAFDRSHRGLDPHLADQILIYLLDAKMGSRYVTSKVTSHLRTGIWIINQFLPDRASLTGDVVEIR